MKRLQSLVGIILTLLFFTHVTIIQGQKNFWSPTKGPNSGYIWAMASNNSNGYIFAGGDKGIFRSTDNGATWERVGLFATEVFAIAIKSNNEIYAGTSSGVAKSTNNGATWKIAGMGQPIIKSLAFTPTEGVIYAGANGGIILRSDDSGQTWTTVHNAVYFSTDVLGIVVGSNNEIYAGTYGSKVWKSEDNGQTWSQLENGLTSSGIVSMEIIRKGPVQNDVIFAGANAWIFKSDDNGDTWTQVGLEDQTTIYDLEYRSGTVWAGTGLGVYRSPDEGQTWITHNNNFADSFLVRSVTHGGEIFAGTNGNGVFSSSPSSAYWQQVGVPYPYANAFGESAAGDKLFVATNDSLFVTTNEGINWTRSNTGLTSRFIYSIVTNKTNGNLFCSSTNGVFKSSDEGLTWQEMNTGLSNKKVTPLAINKAGDLFAGTNNSLFRWEDANQTWEKINIGLTDSNITAITVDMQNENIYVATFLEGVFVSNDNGDSWTPFNGGINWFKPTIGEMLIDTANHFIFAGTQGNGLFRSPLDTANWEQIVNGIPDGNFKWITGLVTSDSSKLFVATSDSGVFCSTDHGANWTAVNSGLDNLNTTALGKDSKGNLYCGTNGNVIYKGSDIPTDIFKADNISEDRLMLNLYPNPAQGQSIINFYIPCRECIATLSVYNILGEKADAILSGIVKKGLHQINWNSEAFNSGIYVLRLETEGKFITKKVVIE